MQSILPRIFLALLACALSLPAADPGIRPEVASLLPPEAVTIGGLEIQALRGTPLFGRLASRFPIESGEQLQQIFSLAGFDPKQDIDRILASSDGAPGESSRATLVILEGRFDVAGAESGLLALFNPAGEHAGVKLYKTISDRGNPNDSTFAFLDPRTVLIGSEAQVQAAIDRWRSPSADSRTAVAALSQHGAHVWASTLEPEKILAAWVDKVPGGGGPLRAISQSMQTLSIRATALAGAVNAQMAFLCGSPADAQSLSDAAQTMAAFGALTAQRDRPELAALLSTLQIGHSDSEATLSIDLSEAQLASLHP